MEINPKLVKGLSGAELHVSIYLKLKQKVKLSDTQTISYNGRSFFTGPYFLFQSYLKSPLNMSTKFLAFNLSRFICWR